MPRDHSIKRVLIIGSGPIIIGQAAEFDYSGTQAARSLRQEGIEVILINDNPATIMTDPVTADHVYLWPLEKKSIIKILKSHQIDAVLPTMGGQTALNLAIDCDKAGIWEKFGVRMIGVDIKAIETTEDREKFRLKMIELGVNVCQGHTATSYLQGKEIAQEIGFPLVIRPSFTLGGYGGGFVHTPEEFDKALQHGLHASPVHEVLIEKSIVGWKEYELELLRDNNQNIIIICSIENFDPMGVHTGDSITVAPAMTLPDTVYQQMRDLAIKMMNGIGQFAGGCNVQFSVNPENDEIIAIEINPRVSRSSALASKATGYPIAKIAAKLAIGYNLDELKNPITGTTSAFFEPTLDYVIVKIPRWNFDKFPGANRTLGLQMKSVGEAMGIGRTFQEALQKACQSLEIKRNGIGADGKEITNYEVLIDNLKNPSWNRVFSIKDAMKLGIATSTIREHTKIDPWFLAQIEELNDMENEIGRYNLNTIPEELLRQAKVKGYADRQIAHILRCLESEVYKKRMEFGIHRVYKMVDTCAAEFEARTPYYYSTFENSPNPLPHREGASSEPEIYTANPQNWDYLKEYGREMRNNPTPAEEVLWQQLRKEKLGVKFRRQHTIEDAIGDFVALEKRLVVEVDGGVHTTPEQAEYDEGRTARLQELGYRVIRFTNEEVLENMPQVLAAIRIELDSPTPNPLPHREGASSEPFGSDTGGSAGTLSPMGGEGRGEGAINHLAGGSASSLSPYGGERAGERGARQPDFANLPGNESIPSDRKKVLVLGSGPNRIGQGIEFDYSCVHGVLAAREMGYETIMINCNPETVSTDPDISDKLYFEPVFWEHIYDIIQLEKPEGVIVQLGGQTALKLAEKLERYGIKILGTSFQALDLAEDRGSFSTLLQELGIPYPRFGTITKAEEAKVLARELGFPLLVRPSYVLGGQQMKIVINEKELEAQVIDILKDNPGNKVLLDHFLENAIEAESDSLCDGEDVHIIGIMEHIEPAGIHSGDSYAVLPPFNLSENVIRQIEEHTRRIAIALKTVGLCNIQFAVKDEVVYVIEANPRASRTVPFIAKAYREPYINYATKIMLGEKKVKDFDFKPHKEGYAIKVPVFSFHKFQDVNKQLGPEMKSTGEAIRFIDDLQDDYFLQVYGERNLYLSR